ncbi:Uncharacterised protein [Acinetobacter baumannii]|uniref:hypothetical protein n=1 Tax=Acinetobacter baumannii TaxID=470 RepID=UPI000B8C3445|nr:hypothetical protein [Acinetobacter baumannii]WCF71533.1 hypothetical protein Acba1_035 [Acinetobacter phage Acba_1]WCF71908.1 hypothetical protein ACBA15_027 [Acinetobacter phage Acba_15]WCF71972.1 hypothetical protein ACBA16_010 [Acinetobacter phage Acba_16]WDS61422.1 hypothetical protein Acba4_062 [Acinetobacter phage Acba_4]WDS61495.1 hypothetical protein AClW8_019 [Acinetobacter phage Aclw_8]
MKVFKADLDGGRFKFQELVSIPSDIQWDYSKKCFDPVNQIYIFHRHNLSFNELDELKRQFFDEK